MLVHLLLMQTLKIARFQGSLLVGICVYKGAARAFWNL